MRKRYSLLATAVLVSVANVAFAAEAPNKYESTIVGFEQQDKTTPPPKDAILFVGSSTIRIWDLKKGFPQYDTINRGFGGSEMSDAVYYADRIVVPYKPKAIVLYSGDNDSAAGKSAKRIADDFKAFIEKVRAKLPGTPMIVLSIKPSVARKKLIPIQKEANSLIADYCRQGKNLYYVDMVPDMLDEKGEPRADYLLKDGLHLNESGYAVWNKKVAQELESIVPSKAKTPATK